MVNVTNHQGNANQNHEISPYICSNGRYQREKMLTAGEDVKGALVHSLSANVKWCREQIGGCHMQGVGKKWSKSTNFQL